MQGSFEKKVQEKLDSLNLIPSAPVWEKIELQIKREKKRRGGLLWFPFLIILFSGAAWWLWEARDVKEETIAPSVIHTPSVREQSNTTPSVTAEKKNKVLVIRAIPEQNKPSFYTDNILQRNGQRETAFRTPSTTKEGLAIRNQKGQLSTDYKEPETQKMLPQLIGKKMRNPAIVENESSPDINVTNEKGTTLPNDSVLQSQTLPLDSALIPAKRDTVAAKRKVALLNKKCKFFLSVQTGWSSPASAQLFSRRLDYTSPTQNAGSGFSNNLANANSNTGNFAYTVGAGLSRPISSRLEVRVELNYAAYGTQTKVGSFRSLDTILRFQSSTVDVGGYYRNGNQHDYTTSSHVLEIPVSLEYKLWRALPLYVSAGSAYGRLLKINALTFDRISNVYYKNNQNLNHYHFVLSSSAQYGIINKKSFSLRAGPVVQYQLTTFQKDLGTATQRLVFAGVKTSVEF